MWSYKNYHHNNHYKKIFNSDAIRSIEEDFCVFWLEYIFRLDEALERGIIIKFQNKEKIQFFITDTK